MSSNNNHKDVLMRVDNLVKHFPIMKGFFQKQVGAVRAVDGVSFDIHRGEHESAMAIMTRWRIPPENWCG